MKGVQLDRMVFAFGHEHPVFEQHDADIDAALAGRDDARPQAVKVGRVELPQVELRLAVQGLSRSGPDPRLRLVVGQIPNARGG